MPNGDAPDHAVRLTLELHGAAISMAFSDSDGRFSISGLERGVYEILINDEKFRPIDETVNVNAEIADPTVVRLVLTPKETTSAATPGTGKNPNMAGVAELKSFPKPAMKEYEKGVRANEDGRTDDAIEHYQKAIKLAPDHYLARNNLGSAYLGKSQFDQAREQFEEAIKINPADAAGYLNLGNMALMTRKYEDASHWIEQGLTKEPNNARGHFLQGSVYAETGHADLAEKELRTSLQLDPKTTRAYLGLVNLYLRQGRKADAANELRQYLKESPNDAFSLKAQEVLGKLETELKKEKKQ